MKNRFLFLFLFSLLVQNVFAQPPDSLKNTLSLGQNYTHFDKQFSDDWHMTSLEYKTQAGKGAIIGRPLNDLVQNFVKLKSVSLGFEFMPPIMALIRFVLIKEI